MGRTRIVFLIIGGGHFVEEFSRRINKLHLDQNFRFLPYQDQATLMAESFRCPPNRSNVLGV